MNSGSGDGGTLFTLISKFGESFLRCASIALGCIFAKPLIFIVSCLSGFIKAVLRGIIMLFAPDGENRRDFAARVNSDIKRALKTAKSHPRSVPALVFHRIKKAVSGFRFSPRKLCLWLIPATAALALAFTLNYYSTACIALKIDCGGETLGYVSKEKDYIEARYGVQELLSLAGGEISMPEISYSLAVININQYTTRQALSENIIRKTQADLSYACGIYIDGEFLCAVKNENQARGVFKEILSDYEGEGLIASFAEKIEYREGLYPDNNDIIWNISRLRRNVSSAGTQREYYTAVAGDTLKSAAEKTGKSEQQLKSLNPGLEPDMLISGGTQLLISESEGFLTVKIIKTEVSNEAVDYDTVEIKSDALYSGSTRVLLNGEKGAAQITSLVTYINGERVSSGEVARLIVKEPVARRIQTGTKPVDEAYSLTLGGILIWPVVNADNINSDYGYRWGKLHAAIDIGSSVGTSLGKTIVAAAGGTVQLTSVHSSYGYYLIIDHGNGMQTLYAHCLADSFMVTPGQTVVAGQPIARVGRTGFATGPHLHFEVRINGSRVNPRPYLGI